MPLDGEIVEAVKAADFGWRFTLPKLRAFVEEMETSLANHLAAIAAKHEEALESMKRATPLIVPENYEVIDASLMIDGLPTVMRYSLFLIVFGVFEHHVAAACRNIHKTGKMQCDGPTKNHLFDSKSYLDKIVGPDAFGEAWKAVYEARILRNFVAHDAGHLPTAEEDRDPKIQRDAEAARRFIAPRADIHLDDNDIEMDKTFVPAMLDEMETVFRDLRDRVTE